MAMFLCQPSCKSVKVWEVDQVHLTSLGFQDGRELYDGETETIPTIRDKERKRYDETRAFTIDAERGVTHGVVYKAVCARIREAHPQRVNLSWILAEARIELDMIWGRSIHTGRVQSRPSEK